MDSPQRKLDNVKQLLCDISKYLRSELQAHDYQNSLAKDNSHGNEIECKNLLERCEEALIHMGLNNEPPDLPDMTANTPVEYQESSYLDMSAKLSAQPNVYVDVSSPYETDCDPKKLNNTRTVATKENYREIYDICDVSLQTGKSLDDTTEALDCPFAGLPVSHLSIQKSPKQGQLFRLEKRLFFDQSKKLYCGIMQDWMLCYSDGINGIRPTFCINLNGVEIEHYGEGKRRDVCFQITDYEAGKKIIFQATSEIDTKEWIHAIEAAIRGDNSVNSSKISALRKLPTPPVQSKIYKNSDILNDGIYEEPSSIYVQLNEELPQIICDDENLKPPNLPAKGCPKAKVTMLTGVLPEYDVPKTQARKSCLNSPEEQQIARNKSEFQTKIKDVHSKLSNQLSSGGSIKSPDREKNMKKSAQLVTTPSVKAVKIQLFKDKSTVHQGDGDTLCTTTTPVKKWFLNRLNKSTSPEKKRHPAGDKEKENLLHQDGCGALGADHLKTPTKQGKVNMIINQLEANGHLPIFTKNLERFSSAFTDQGDDCNYEPIVTMGKY